MEQRPFVTPPPAPADVVARSAAMQRVLELAARAASTEATVLITGESGTGKERLARYIHDHSSRRRGRFVAVNCGALPEPLLENELFGHKRGAYTGATHDAHGLFTAADKGTLFLDEVAEMAQALQVRLLRALQERTVRPVGGTREVAVDVRIIAATNQDLEALVENGTFRKDLYYRLRVVPFHMPPLRARRADILWLARGAIARTCHENACGPCALSSDVLDLLLAYDWPGNVRELENTIERAVILAEDRPTINANDLPPEIRDARGGSTRHDSGRIPTLAEVERRHIFDTLERLGGHRKNAARALGIGENTLHRKLRRYGVGPRHTAPTADRDRAGS